MVHSIQRADVMAVENDLVFQLVPVLLDMVVLDHDDYHLYFIEELVEVQNLVLHNLLLCEEWVESLERTSQVALLDVKHLKSGTLTNVIYILLIGESV